MNIRNYFQISFNIKLLCYILVLLSSCVADNEKFTKRDNLPNIIFILADDMGYGDINCLNPESKIPTPNLDKLAEQGMTFTDAHSSSSLCSPTRYGILTGRYSWRSKRQGGALWKFAPPLIEDKTLTVPQYLKNHGYSTACIGKWHLGIDWQNSNGEIVKLSGSEKGWSIDFTKKLKNGPTSKGFDYFFGMDAPNYPPYCYIENDETVGIPSISKPDSIYGVPGIMLENWDLAKVLPELENKAVQYINKQAKSGNPFFLYFPLTGPHTPIVPIKEHIGKSKAGPYGDFVHQIDGVVGSILKTLDENDLAQNTLLIFTSDNGSPCMDGSGMKDQLNSIFKYDHYPNYIYRGKKADAWEGGHRMPFIARWPGQIKSNSKSDETICLTDLFATCAAILGDKLPADAGEDSYNILPVMMGDESEDPIREATVHLSGDGSFAIRQDNWKLILCPGSGGSSLSPETAMQRNLPMIQLYNLETDIEEKNNLYNRYPDVVHRLINLLEKYVEQGRSTPGLVQKNTGEPDIWRSLKIRDTKYNINSLSHLAVGKKVKLLNNIPLNFSKDKQNVLTDGIRASSLFSDGYWIGVEGNDLEVLLDLEKEISISKITTGFLEDQSHWIFLPTNVQYSFSKDGKNFYSEMSILGKELVDNETRIIKDFTLEINKESCRFIKINASGIKTCPEWHKGAGGKAWLFMDEIIVN